ncbi:SNARE-interacting protein KEULE [Platanthera guangdongensis]|uniref:SNARE-interacting protein KEULE n=1 Tax=Platanthera guangdongensis TaxID=2320717 RepID=A0ABR2LNL9_9ASPA
MSESGSSRGARAGDYKTFRQTSRDRLLHEMLQSPKVKESESAWKVLIMDKFTVKIMSYSCRMADITDAGISLVEDLFKRRQPMASMDAIYFIQPSKENIIMFLSDMSGRCPLYKKAYVYFSSPIPKELVSYIKNDSSVIPRIGALSEMNLEYCAIDSQGFITDHEMTLGDLYGESAQNAPNYSSCLNMMAIRIATAFASMQELPYVRYRAAKSSSNAASEASSRDLIPTKLAAEVWNFISKYKTTIPDFPQKETCDLLIVDRSIDLIAPVIHEWTYDAMCHDLLNMDGNKYTYEVPRKSGSMTVKEVLLEDHDPIWLELRHAHIADASERLHDKMMSFRLNNKAAQLQQTAKDGGELSTRDLKKIAQALPQYNDQMEKLSLHVEIAGRINTLISDLKLRDLGKLEQDIIFGDAGAKELINFLRTNQNLSQENKLRLLMIYACVYPEKIEGDAGIKLMQLAKLSTEDMSTVSNLKYLGGLDTKKASGVNFSLKFDTQKRNHAARKEREDEEEAWQLSRFYPMLEELVEKLNKGELQKKEYPYMNEPALMKHAAEYTSASAQKSPDHAPHSIRSRRTPTWAKQRVSDDGNSSDSVLRHASSDCKRMGQRIFVFMIGGATRSELRSAHKLTAKIRREVIIGSSSLEDPPLFIKKLKLLSSKQASETAKQIPASNFYF